MENIIPLNVIINLGCTSVDNHIPRDDIFDYHPLWECNIYIIYLANCEDPDEMPHDAESHQVYSVYYEI